MKTHIILTAVLLVAIAIALGAAAKAGYLDRNIIAITGFSTQEVSRPAPADRIAESSIIADESTVTIKLPNAVLGRLDDSGSMNPVLQGGSNTLMVRPEKSSDLGLGDIVAYQAKDVGLIVHRIVKIGNDENGWYAVTKGDNNNDNDPENVRFSDIKYVIVGILY